VAKIYDTTIFFNEVEMLELRLNILDPVVDYFVIVEAAETHSGQPKPYNFLANQERFDRWLHKIIYVQIDDLTGDGRNSWQREAYHRARIADGLTEARPQDWIIVSDVDEIAHPAMVATLKDVPRECQAVKLELDFYYYDFNHRVREGWAIGAYRWGREQDPNKIRTCASGKPVDFALRDSGWHFSWFNGTQAILDKHAAFMHANDPVIRDMPRDPALVAAKVQAGQDLFDRPGFAIDRVPLSPTLPKYVLDNIEHYRALGWVAE
jgi:beta-1,4-mannosyl-glycoprotein beta-1,4-N-acetylglucosaminyltransferase